MNARRLVVLLLALGLVSLSTLASAQTRTRAAVQEVSDDEGSGEAVQERAYDPRGNEARQSDHIRTADEGNEDDQGGEEGQGGN